MQSRSAWLGVRERSTQELHAVLIRFQRILHDGGELTEGQDRWWDQAVAELTWRSARKRRRYRRCWCELCFTDFDLRDPEHGAEE